MGLSPGTRLAPYEIVAPLGAGGMGDVYRARDTRLDRTVAMNGFSKQVPRISPDGRWIAYDESGQAQIYLESFPERTGKWQVSSAGGMQPRWSGDGRRIYFLSPDNKVTAAEIAFTASGPEVTKISERFAVPPSIISGGNPLDVTRDGSHFVLNARRPDAGDTWNVPLNRTSLVKK
jgi:eukaryotic-like serine/threonine-protein kinase